MNHKRFRRFNFLQKLLSSNVAKIAGNPKSQTALQSFLRTVRSDTISAPSEHALGLRCRKWKPRRQWQNN